MQQAVSEDGCAMFSGSVALDLADQQRTFKWGIVLDGPQGSPRDAIHLLFASEKVRPSYALPTADVDERVTADDYEIVSLEALLRMKLNSFRDKDRTHLRDLISLGLVDASWLPRLVPEHATRLRQLIDDPDG